MIAASARVAGLIIVLNFLSIYVLPALYGLLGAYAYILRKLSDDRDTVRLDDARVQYSLRLYIGALAGLAVGWFISPDQNAGVVANLSPLALAFVAGYGSDLLFALLDRIVDAFTGPSKSEALSRARERATEIYEPLATHHSEAQRADGVSVEEKSRREHVPLEQTDKGPKVDEGERSKGLSAEKSQVKTQQEAAA